MADRYTTPDLISHVTFVTGRDPSVVRTVQSSLRARGIHPAASRGATAAPQVEKAHGAALLIALLAGGPQSSADFWASALWKLPSYEPLPQDILTSLSEFGVSIDKQPTFGRMVYCLVEAGMHPKGRGWVESHVTRVAVEHDPIHAEIRAGDHVLEFGLPSSPVYRSRRRNGAIVDVRYMGSRPLVEVAKFVWASRDEARRLGITISEAEALRILEAPLETQPDPFAGGNQEENTTTPESKEAVEAPPSTASLNGRSARARNSPGNKVSFTHTHPPKATSSGEGGRSHPRSRAGGSGRDDPKQQPRT